ncbi:hypothetical protein NDU88_006291 [Pleurodeles waltl]|uniref:Uncharacterized protein n=1 Tax=Pleurodeles waltl TaxID=8319 RepID=A0AAV7SP28_PLEWA|nr:hypothetical protein NDU88_006291 [Pleurodeles waltl]
MQAPAVYVARWRPLVVLLSREQIPKVLKNWNAEIGRGQRSGDGARLIPSLRRGRHKLATKTCHLRAIRNPGVRDADTSGCPLEKFKGVAGPRPAFRGSGETSGPVPHGAAAGGRDRFPWESANHAVLLLGPTEVRGPEDPGRNGAPGGVHPTLADESWAAPGRPAPCGATFGSQDKLLRVLAGCAVPLLGPEKVRGSGGARRPQKRQRPRRCPNKQTKKGLGPRLALRGAGEPGGSREACARRSCGQQPGSAPASVGKLRGPAPGPHGGEGAWGGRKTPGETVQEMGGRTALPEQDAALDNAHADRRGSDWDPAESSQQAYRVESIRIDQARPHIERKKVGPDLCARNQQQVGPSQRVGPGWAPDQDSCDLLMTPCTGGPCNQTEREPGGPGLGPKGPLTPQ